MVDGDEGVRRCCKTEAACVLKFKRQMLIPDAVVVQLQFISTVAADAERKTADHRLGARLFSRKDVELDHQKIRRGT